MGWIKIIHNTVNKQHAIESIAQCILSDIIAYYETEEGRRQFQERKARQEAELTEGKNGETG